MFRAVRWPRHTPVYPLGYLTRASISSELSNSDDTRVKSVDYGGREGSVKRDKGGDEGVGSKKRKREKRRRKRWLRDVHVEERDAPLTGWLWEGLVTTIIIAVATSKALMSHPTVGLPDEETTGGSRGASFDVGPLLAGLTNLVRPDAHLARRC